MLAATLAWCACDVGGRIYACFGFDYAACERFTHMYTDSMGGTLTCWIK
jgi:hypothetical protein